MWSQRSTNVPAIGLKKRFGSVAGDEHERRREDRAGQREDDGRQGDLVDAIAEERDQLAGPQRRERAVEGEADVRVAADAGHVSGDGRGSVIVGARSRRRALPRRRSWRGRHRHRAARRTSHSSARGRPVGLDPAAGSGASAGDASPALGAQDQRALERGRLGSAGARPVSGATAVAPSGPRRVRVAPRQADGAAGWPPPRPPRGRSGRGRRSRTGRRPGRGSGRRRRARPRSG